MRYNERALIVGKTRSGKSTFARYLFAHFSGVRRVLVNVKGKLDIGVPATSSVDAIDWRAPVTNFVPRTFSRPMFEELYAAIWAHRNVPTLIWLDEAAAVTTANYAPDSLLLVQQQGGEWNVGHLVCAQRAKNVKMELRTEADELYIFTPPPSQADLAWLADEIGEVDGHELTAQDLRRRLRDLDERYRPPGQPEGSSHAFLRWIRATGELEECEPLHAGWVTTPLRNVGATSKRPSARREASLDRSE